MMMMMMMLMMIDIPISPCSSFQTQMRKTGGHRGAPIKATTGGAATRSSGRGAGGRGNGRCSPAKPIPSPSPSLNQPTPRKVELMKQIAQREAALAAREAALAEEARQLEEKKKAKNNDNSGIGWNFDPFTNNAGGPPSKSSQISGPLSTTSRSSIGSSFKDPTLKRPRHSWDEEEEEEEEDEEGAIVKPGGRGGGKGRRKSGEERKRGEKMSWTVPMMAIVADLGE
jgi:hypothetical protein